MLGAVIAVSAVTAVQQGEGGGHAGCKVQQGWLAAWTGLSCTPCCMRLLVSCLCQPILRLQPIRLAMNEGGSVAVYSWAARTELLSKSDIKEH